MSRPGRREWLAPVAAVAVTVGLVAGCGGNPRVDAGPEPATTTAAAPAATSTTTPSASPASTPVTSSPARQRVEAANRRMADTLSQFTAAAARRDAAMTFGPARQSINSGMSLARKALAAERAAAYSGTRSCSRVAANAATVRSAAGQVLSAAAQQRATIARVRTELGRVDAVRALVVKRLVELQAALKVSPSAEIAPVVTAVQKAVSAESSRRKAVLVEVADVESRTRSAAGSAARARQQAGVIQTKAC